MQIPRVDRQVVEFVVKLVNAGSMLEALVLSLVDALSDDVYPGEDAKAVVLEMLCATIGTALASVDPKEIERATELIDLARARTLEHLHLALDLRRRMESGDGARGRTYG